MTGNQCDFCKGFFRDTEGVVNVDEAIFFYSKDHQFEVELLGGIARYHKDCFKKLVEVAAEYIPSNP